MRLDFQRQQFSSIHAKGLRRLKLRPDLHISEQTINGKRSYVIKLPGESSYFRFGELEYEILRNCDGTRTPAELAAEMIQRHSGLYLKESHVIDFLDSVESPVWERSRAERNLALLRRLREQRRYQVDHSSLFNIRFKPWNPDRLLGIVNDYCGWVFTRGFVVASVGLFLVTIYLLGMNWDRIVADTDALYSLEGRFSYDVLTFWVLLMVFEAIHEFGHGVVCKHYGGEVPEVGFSLVYFTPSFYMDTTDMLLFNRRQRYWVIFAGVWIELLFCGLATLVWAFTLPGTSVNDFAYKALLLSGIDTIVWNLNPLIQADGYYALADYWGIDNLAESAQQYLQLWVRTRWLGQDVQLPSIRPRQKRIFLAYSIASIANMILLAIGSLLFVKAIFLNQLGVWGYVLLAGGIVLLARDRLATAAKAAKNWMKSGKVKLMVWKMSRMQKAGLAGIVLLAMVPPIPFHVKSDFVLEPSSRVNLRPKVDGKVSEIFVKEGDVVKAGQIVARLENPEVSAESEVLFKELSLTNGELRTREYQSDSSGAAQANHQRARLQAELSVAENQRSSLELIAPMDGMIATPLLEQKLGESLSAGEDFCQIVNRETLRARILVHDWDFQDVHPGAVVKLKVEAYPFTTYSGVVEQVLPAAAKDQPIGSPEKPQSMGQELTNYMALIVSVKNPDGRLREGMNGTARISGKSHSLAWHSARRVWRWLRAQVF